MFIKRFFAIVNSIDCFLTDSVDDHFTSVFNDAWFFESESEATEELIRINQERLPWQKESRIVEYFMKEE